MCNGISSRTSQGGSIAVLRRTKSNSSRELAENEEWRLLFSNNHSGEYTTGTQVELKGAQPSRRREYQVIIHRTGDLSSTEDDRPSSSSSSSTSSSVSDPFLSFRLDAHHRVLPHQLDLGVGDTGIIGRKVSVLSYLNGSKSEECIAEGIIGWN